MTSPEPRRRIDVGEATDLILANMPAWPAVPVPLDEAAGEILRQDLVAERDTPPFDRVTMDGIALRHAALAAGRREFTVLGTQGAGNPALTLGADGDCVAVMTGAALPAGADTVIPVERLERDGTRARIAPDYAATKGQFVHRRGSDHRAGAVLLGPGTRLGPAEMAVLTIGGRSRVMVARRPAIAVISTGNELADPGGPIGEFQIRASNAFAISAALRARGYGRLTRARLPDDPAILGREIGRLRDSHDVLVLSGGVSMGEFDHVPRVLADLGMGLVFHRVLQRPGLPLWFGLCPDGKPVFALPGNPVSSLVCLVRYVVPALDAALGARPCPPHRVQLTEAVRFGADLTWFLPVVLGQANDGGLTARPAPTNTSGDFVALAGTDGSVELPRGGKVFPAGFVADFYSWDGRL